MNGLIPKQIIVMLFACAVLTQTELTPAPARRISLSKLFGFNKIKPKSAPYSVNDLLRNYPLKENISGQINTDPNYFQAMPTCPICRDTFILKLSNKNLTSIDGIDQMYKNNWLIAVIDLSHNKLTTLATSSIPDNNSHLRKIILTGNPLENLEQIRSDFKKEFYDTVEIVF